MISARCSQTSKFLCDNTFGPLKLWNPSPLNRTSFSLFNFEWKIYIFSYLDLIVLIGLTKSSLQPHWYRYLKLDVPSQVAILNNFSLLTLVYHFLGNYMAATRAVLQFRDRAWSRFCLLFGKFALFFIFGKVSSVPLNNFDISVAHNAATDMS